MGKGFQNFMSKKTFHPGSHHNQRRIQEAEAAAEAKRKHDQETLAQYLKEQELFQQQSLVSRESKDKLSLNFMYSAPPGTSNKKDDQETEEDEDIMLRTSLKWNKEIKKESKSHNQSGPVRVGTGNNNDDDDDDNEPRIILKWKRTEPKSKNKRPQPAGVAIAPAAATNPGSAQPTVKDERPDAKPKLDQQPNIKRIKKER